MGKLKDYVFLCVNKNILNSLSLKPRLLFLANEESTFSCRYPTGWWHFLDKDSVSTSCYHVEVNGVFSIRKAAK